MTVSITDRDIGRAIKAFSELISPSLVVIRSQVNRVPPPRTAFMAMTPISRRQMATAKDRYTDTEEAQTQNVSHSIQARWQLDYYGDQAEADVQTFFSLFNDMYAFDHFPKAIKPLYAETPSQVQTIDGERQYLQHWRMDIFLNIHPVVTAPMEFFDKKGEVTVTPVDVIPIL